MQDREISLHPKWLHMNAMGNIDAEMRIKALGSRLVQTNRRKVLLADVSPTHIRFKTTLWMPPPEAWTVVLAFTMEGIPMEAVGLITQAAEEDGWWTYEVELRHDPVIRTLLTRVLNQRLKSCAPMIYRIHETYRKHDW